MARNKIHVDEDLQTLFNPQHLKRLMGYLKPFSKKLLITAFLMIISSLILILGPFLVKETIDVIIPEKNTTLLIIIATGLLVAQFINSICLKYRIRFMSVIAQEIIYNIRKDLFTHLQKLPFTYFDNRPHGKIIIRVVNYVNALNELLQNGIINVITDSFSLIFIIVFMFIIDVRLTFISLVGLPLLMLIAFLLKRIQRIRWQRLSSKQSNMNAYIHESICGIKVTQSFAREEENKQIFDTCNKEYKKSWLSTVSIIHLTWPISENISVLSISLLYFVGVSWITNGLYFITVGTLILFTSYIGALWQPIINFGNFYNQIVMAMAYLERIFETLDEEIDVKDIQGAYDIPMINGNVTFEHVEFGYEENNQILKGISFQVEPGERIALVGSTGSGKTTIINLISRFYNVQEGKILVDGHDISKVTLASLRQQMGIMMQDTFIFSGTIMDNIRYGKLDATDEEILNAAKQVKAHDFIVNLENGYHTEVNERGSRLSVGQRQLISFARVLLANPAILILDEATSSIDTKTEMALQEGLDQLLKGRTSFVVAHRLATIKDADRIFYIEEGKIIESGTHNELIEQQGAYYKLFMTQYEMLNDEKVS